MEQRGDLGGGHQFLEPDGRTFAFERIDPRSGVGKVIEMVHYPEPDDAVVAARS